MHEFLDVFKNYCNSGIKFTDIPYFKDTLEEVLPQCVSEAGREFLLGNVLFGHVSIESPEKVPLFAKLSMFSYFLKPYLLAKQKNKKLSVKDFLKERITRNYTNLAKMVNS